MCGIAGWYRRGERPVDPAIIAAQCARIVHRGPDDGGRLIDRDFGFGMRRLSILDLAGGHQPIESADGRHAIVFNGEIYNHLALRPALEAAGHAFTTRSDTETVLAAFRHWGVAAWEKLEGMFAVAVWDRGTRTLTLARDPLGIKPLYVAAGEGGVAFASELKALTPVPGIDWSVDERAVHDFFSFGHILTPRSVHAGVRTLPPGQTLTIGPDGDPIEAAFWRPRFTPGPAMDEAEWIEAFRREWLGSVERHMLADVPLGAFLSGGVDSSAVVAAMARLSSQSVRAYTIGFAEPRYDETRHAEAVARHLGCEHVIRRVEPRHAADVLPQVAAAYDEPFADPAAVPLWHLCELAAGEVKVVLGGDGGDELFAGYARHRNEALVQRFDALPGALQTLGQLANALPPLPNRRWNYARQRLRRLWASARLPGPEARFFEKTEITTPALRQWLYEPAFHQRQAHGYAALASEYFPAPASADPVERFLAAEMTLQLPCAMLTKVDRVSMAHSLEVRVPFLSRQFADWAGTVPMGMKLQGSTGKALVRKAIAPWLPAGVLDRPKQGFQVPLAEWFLGDFGAHAYGLWRDSGAGEAGFLRPAAVDRILADHRAGRADHSGLLYALAIFGLWWRARPRTALSTL